MRFDQDEFIYVLVFAILINMAWSVGHTSTNADLIRHLSQMGILKTPAIIDAMKSVDRANYANCQHPYDDTPQYIGFKATISAPRMLNCVTI